MQLPARVFPTLATGVGAGLGIAVSGNDLYAANYANVAQASITPPPELQ